MAKNPMIPSPVVVGPELDVSRERCQRLEEQLAELAVHIERLAKEEAALRIAAEEADALAPTDKLRRLRTLADLERRVREADKATWALLDDLFGLRQEVLSTDAINDGEAPHDN